MSKLGSASSSLATLQICIPATQSTSERSNRKRDMYRPRKQASGHLVKQFWSPGERENNLERRREDVVQTQGSLFHGEAERMDSSGPAEVQADGLQELLLRR